MRAHMCAGVPVLLQVLGMRGRDDHEDGSGECRLHSREGRQQKLRAWREKDRDKAEAVAAREEEERGNAMKASHPAWLCAQD